MAHARIDRLAHLRAERAKNTARFAHPRQRDMRIDVAATKKHRRFAERSRIVARRALRSDQSRAQARNRAVTPRMARDIFERQASALREAEYGDALRGKSLLLQGAHGIGD